MSFWKSLFGRATPQALDPSDPAYVPVPKAKDPAAVHPGVAANLAKPRMGRATGVGIVYDRDGVPKIAPDFLGALSPVHRTWAANDLLQHGYRLNDDNTITLLEGSQ